MRNPLFPAIIPTKSLKLADVPNESEPWPVIGRFALTFDPSEDTHTKLTGGSWPPCQPRAAWCGFGPPFYGATGVEPCGPRAGRQHHVSHPKDGCFNSRDVVGAKQRCVGDQGMKKYPAPTWRGITRTEAPAWFVDRMAHYTDRQKGFVIYKHGTAVFDDSFPEPDIVKCNAALLDVVTHMPDFSVRPMRR
jgi:hypothetical protein